MLAYAKPHRMFQDSRQANELLLAFVAERDSEHFTFKVLEQTSNNDGNLTLIQFQDFESHTHNHVYFRCNFKKWLRRQKYRDAIDEQTD